MSEQGSSAPYPQKESLSTWRIVGICSSMFGFQIVYSAIFALADPIMNSLKLSEESSLLAWSCGPLAGFLVQPIIGYYSDRCKSSWGKRRPFILFGCSLTWAGLIFLLILKEYGMNLARILKGFYLIVILFITFSSTNIYQAASRALIGDIVPTNQLDRANSIASIIISIASVFPNYIGGIGYFLNSITYATKVNSITIISSVSLTIISVLITLFCAKEVPNKVDFAESNPFLEIYRAFRKIPKELIGISFVLFLSWISYFPFCIKITSFFENEVFPPSEKAKGLCFGMLTLGTSYVFVLIYGFIHDFIVAKIGLKNTFSFSLILESLCLSSVLFISDRWGLLLSLAPMGICFFVMNSVPFAILAKVIPESEMGIYIGVLNCFIVIGQQISNVVVIYYGMKYYKQIVPELTISKIRASLGLSASVAIFASIICLFTDFPKGKSEIEHECL